MSGSHGLIQSKMQSFIAAQQKKLDDLSGVSVEERVNQTSDIYLQRIYHALSLDTRLVGFDLTSKVQALFESTAKNQAWIEEHKRISASSMGKPAADEALESIADLKIEDVTTQYQKSVGAIDKLIALEVERNAAILAVSPTRKAPSKKSAVASQKKDKETLRNGKGSCAVM